MALSVILILYFSIRLLAAAGSIFISQKLFSAKACPLMMMAQQGDYQLAPRKSTSLTGNQHVSPALLVLFSVIWLRLSNSITFKLAH